MNQMLHKMIHCFESLESLLLKTVKMQREKRTLTCNFYKTTANVFMKVESIKYNLQISKYLIAISIQI